MRLYFIFVGRDLAPVLLVVDANALNLAPVLVPNLYKLPLLVIIVVNNRSYTAAIVSGAQLTYIAADRTILTAITTALLTDINSIVRSKVFSLVLAELLFHPFEVFGRFRKLAVIGYFQFLNIVEKAECLGGT